MVLAGECAQTKLMAIALIVEVSETDIVPEKTVPLVTEGVEPSVVYFIVASGVGHEIKTCCAEVNVPELGDIVGVRTLPV